MGLDIFGVLDQGGWRLRLDNQDLTDLDTYQTDALTLARTPRDWENHCWVAL